MVFVIQTKKGQILTDIGKAIVEAVDYQKWYNAENYSLSYRLQQHYEKIQEDEIPVGTIEWTERVSHVSIPATNLPEKFRVAPYVFRHIYIVDRDGLKALFTETAGKRKLFIKSDTHAKVFDPILAKTIEEVPMDTRYFCSEPVEIHAEWRLFFFRGETLDVKCYSGSWTEPLTLEEVKIIKDIFHRAKMPYVAGTVDIARTNYGIEWLEIHNFIACGLYGFDRPDKIIQMAYSAWKDITKEHNYK